MKLLIVGIIVLALSVAGVSTYLIRNFSGEENIEGLQKVPVTKVKVLVAARPIRPGTGMPPDALAWQEWDKDALNEVFIVAENEKEAEAKIKEFSGGTARSAISQGEPILAAKIFKGGSSGILAGMLKKGMRAVSFPASSITAVAGFILPGDHVDILMSHTLAFKKQDKKKGKGSKPQPGGTQELEPKTGAKITETIMRNVTVLAINQAVDAVGPEGGGQISMAAATVTLELTPKQAEILTTARSVGKLSMVLRSLQTPDDESEELSSTLDDEVSPFFSRYKALQQAIAEGRLKEFQARARAEKDRKNKAGQEKQSIADIEKRIRAELEMEMKEADAAKPLPMPVKSAPVEKSIQVIRIFRGTGGKAEEVEVK